MNRSIPLSIILTIVTCGIYGIYWFICLTNEINNASGEGGTSGGVCFLLTIVTCGIYGLYWAYVTGQKLGAALNKRDVKFDEAMPIVYLVLCVFGFSIVTYALMQYELNKIV
ncbi:MAG: DUF4234 domain-containing protein [Bacillota bacterium]|nr:DUF4234 domain-containing protein [Bacillota bacterium]